MTTDDFDLELDRELGELPSPVAPASLLPRVLAAVAPPEPSAWYSRPWLTWPHGLRVASAVAVLVTVAALAGGAPMLRWLSPDLAANVARVLNPLHSLGQAVQQIATITRVFWHVWLEPIALYLLALVVLLSLAVTAALSLVNRLTPERT